MKTPIISATIRGTEVDIFGHDWENSPEINVVGFGYITAEDKDGNDFELTEDEQEKYLIEANEAELNSDPY